MDRDPNYFWLITLGETTVSVSLVATGSSITIQASSRELPWSEGGESVITATANAIESCCQQLGTTPKQEPEKAAFIISPFWVSSDGKITEHKLKLILNTCKQLFLKPMGFMPYDEAVVEEANSHDGIPASFVLVFVDSSQLIVSLTYLGKIKKRIRKIINGPFEPSLLEASITEMNIESALPPLIYLCGKVDDVTGQMVKNYPWIGKKSIETFLHLPEVKIISPPDLTRLFAQIIARQINPSKPNNQPLPAEDEVVSPPLSPTVIDETPLSEFGFTSPSVDSPPVNNTPLAVEIMEPSIVTASATTFINQPSVRPKLHLSLPSIKFPAVSLPLWIYLIVGVFVLITLLLQIISFATVDIYVTPFEFSERVSAFASTQEDPANSALFIPVDQKSIDVTVTDSISTTGKITIGEKSRGEIVIYNKQEKSQNIPKGTIIIFNNLKFELLNDVQVASSSSDLEKGVITLGQTRTSVGAANIGPEYNLSKDQKLEFKDSSFSQLLAKTNSELTGGSKQDVAAVSKADRSQVEANLGVKISQAIKDKISSDFGNLDLALAGTTVTKKNKIDINREIGEQTDLLEGQASATISILLITPETQQRLIDELATRNSKYSEISKDGSQFQLQFISKKVNDTNASGELELTGNAPPQIDINAVIQKIKLSRKEQAIIDIRRLVPRAYEVRIDLKNYSPLKFVDLLPPIPQKIKIIVHSQTQ